MKTAKFHIGFHKTGTTHLQNTLKQIIPELREQKIDCEALEITRAKLVQLLERRRLAKNFNRFPKLTYYLYLKRYLFPHFYGFNTFIRSEENICGRPLGLVEDIKYPSLEKRLTFLQLLQHKVSLEIYLSIRSFDRVLPGAYCTDMRYSPLQALESKKKLGLVTEENKHKFSWLPLVARIKKALPKASITVWTQENYRHHSASIIQQLIGTTSISIPDIPPPKSTMTPSQSAIEEIEGLLVDDTSAIANWSETFDSIIARHSAEGAEGTYNWLNEIETKRLRQVYDEDIKQLANGFSGISFIEK